MGRGIHRGFITHEELNKSLGKRNLSSENLSQAFLHILDEKISLVEKKSDFKSLKKRDSQNKDEPKSLEKSDDPIRMYLREMGGVELLSREGEIAIAKRIEAGKDVMLNALSQSPITAQQFYEWNEKLNKDSFVNLISKFKNPDISSRLGFRENMAFIIGLSDHFLKKVSANWLAINNSNRKKINYEYFN